MLRNLLQFEAKVKDFVSHWHIPNDLPIEIAKEMLFIFSKFVGQIEDNANAQKEAVKQEEPIPVSEPHEVPKPE